MRVLAVTGGIASGKSTITALFRSLGAVVIDADGISRALTARDGAALPLLRDAFGDAVFAEDGALDRKALARRVFGDAAARKTLDALMRPLIVRQMERELDAARADGARVALLDVPLLYEARLEALADRVLCVYVPENVQIARLKERDGMAEDDAKRRIASQMPTAEKLARADYAVDTDAPFDVTRERALAVWNAFLNEA